MNRLWVRMSLGFSVVILVGIVAIALVAVLTTRAHVRQFSLDEQLRAPGALADSLSAYYHTHHSWDGVGPMLTSAQAAFSRVPESMTLTDAKGRIVYDEPGGRVGQTIDHPDQADITIQADGQTVGYLETRPVAQGVPDRQEQFILGRLSQDMVVVAVIGSLLGIMFGVLMSHSLTSPLRRLAETARAIGAHNLNQRVEVSGSAEVRELAQAFNEMAATLEQAETLRRNMIADVAHELRTPLSVLQGNLRAILDDVYPLDKTEVASLYDQTRLLSRLVNDLHELAQAEAGQLQLRLQPTDIAGLVHKAAATFGPVAEARGVTLTCQTPLDLPSVQADSARLTEVLHNLLTNALHFTPAGGTISLSAGQNGKLNGKPASLWLAVHDTGEGILPEHLPRVFDRFYRADPARSRATGGSGLGLAIARAIVEAHGGEMSVASEGVPGSGSVFTIHLPLE
jgi:two-component system OmpR family sensor kinase